MKPKTYVVVWALGLTLLTAGNAGEILRSVTSPGQPGISGAGPSYNPLFSGDGRKLVFVSTANNLVTNDNNLRYLDVFVRDLITSNTVLVSAGLGGSGGGNQDCNYPAISQYGRFVAFESAASNLVPSDTNQASDVFLRDLQAGTTRLVSVDVNGGVPGNPLPVQRADNPLSGNPLIRPDGSLVFFESLASNLVILEDTNLVMDVFARDMLSDETRLVSVNAAGTGAGNGRSRLCAISRENQFVAFTSQANDLVPAGRTGGQELFVRDIKAERTFWASSNALTELEPPAKFHSPVLSTRGEFVFFKKTAYDGTESLWRYELQSGATVCIETNVLIKDPFAISPDGMRVVFATTNGLYWWDGLTNRLIGNGTSPVLSGPGVLVYKVMEGEAKGIYAKTNLEEGIGVLLTRRMDGTDAGFVPTSVPAVSQDGQWIAYESEDTGIVTNDLNQASDIFLVDVNGTSTGLISERHTAHAARTGAGLALARRGCLSADGKKVVFTTMDSSFAARDTNKLQDVFVKDLQSGEVTPISVFPITNVPFLFTRVGRDPVISADGRRVAWVSRTLTTNRSGIAGWFPQHEDVYVLDLANPSNSTLASRTMAGSATGKSRQPTISPNGSMVAFESTATGLVNNVLIFPFITNIYLYDVTTGTNELVSIHTNRLESTGGCENPLFSPDNEWVLFASSGWRLTSVDSFYKQLYAWNVRGHTNRLVSSMGSGAAVAAHTTGGVFSANARYVLFSASDDSQPQYTNHVYRHDLLSNTTNLVVCDDCLNPSCSADGRFVAYETRRRPNDTNVVQVYLKDMMTGEVTLVSSNHFGDGGGSGHSSYPSVSYDGRFVVFASKATNLVDTLTTGTGDVYVWDRILGTMLLASVNAAGSAGGNAKSSHPILGADGRTLVFQSFANDLGAGDYNLTRDIFVLRLAGPDSDGDTLDDGWEVAYFGNLSCDGSGDFDGDGRSDLQEYLAGTDPTDQGAVLRALTVSSMSSGGVRVLWSAAPGRIYRVEYKTALTDPEWMDVSGEVVATCTTGMALDATSPSGFRFYRVVLAR